MRNKNISIVPFEIGHLNEAVLIFTENYQSLLNIHPLLPHKYNEPDEMIPRMKWITSNFPALVLLDDGVVVGYISGIIIPNLKSSRTGVYMPEWAYGIKEDYQHLFDSLHEKMLIVWAQHGCSVFSITVLENQKSLMETLVWNGYGMFVIDTIRDLSMVESKHNVMIRLANHQDQDELKTLLIEHNQYMKNSPTFLYLEDDVESELEEWFKEERRMIFIALDNNKIVGCMHVVIDGDDSCTIIQDHSILKVMTTHVLDEYQGRGIASCLLTAASHWAIEHDYKALAVDFESSNLKARHFWLKHFTPVCYSFIKNIDDRVINI